MEVKNIKGTALYYALYYLYENQKNSKTVRHESLIKGNVEDLTRKEFVTKLQIVPKSDCLFGILFLRSKRYEGKGIVVFHCVLFEEGW